MAKVDWSDPEQVRAYQKAYRETHKEQKQKDRLAFRLGFIGPMKKKPPKPPKPPKQSRPKLSNEEKRVRDNKRAKLYYQNNLSKRRAYAISRQRSYYKTNKKSILEKNKKYKLSNLDLIDGCAVRGYLKSRFNITNPPEDLINLIVANRKLKRAIHEVSK